MAYRLEIMPTAERGLRALPAVILARVDARIQELADDPRPRGAEPIRRRRGGLLVRVCEHFLTSEVISTPRGEPRPTATATRSGATVLIVKGPLYVMRSAPPALATASGALPWH